MSVASTAHTPDAERLLFKSGDPKPSPYIGDVYVGIDDAIAQGQRRGRAGGFSQRHHGARQPVTCPQKLIQVLC